MKRFLAFVFRSSAECVKTQYFIFGKTSVFTHFTDEPRSLLRLEDTNQCGEASSPHVGIRVGIVMGMDVGIGEGC